MATLQEMVANALAQGPVTAETGQQILSQAIQMGASAEDLEALATQAGFSIPQSEIQNFMSHYGLNGSLAEVGSAADTFVPDLQTNLTAPTGANTPIGPVNTAPVVSDPLPVATTTPTTNQPNTTLSPITATESQFGANTVENPGALGWNDLNTVVTGAENTQQTAIPEVLKPFLADSAYFSQGSLQGLGALLSRDNALTSPLNPLQNQAQQMALDIADGQGGFIPQAQAALSEIADPTDIIEQFSTGIDALRNPEGQSALRNFTNTSPINQTSMDQLSGIATGSGLNQTAQESLESTASGDYLFGNEAFDEAVQASIRSAMPHISSQFALQGGAGGLSGGLADTAIAQVASDAFARQFGNERNRQLSASNQLNNFGLSDTSQQITASGLLGNLDLSGRGMQQGAASTLAGLSQNLGNSLISSANQDRDRQLQAVSALPGMGLLPSQIIGQVGDFRQGEEERQKLGQVQAMQQLLNSSFGNINPNALFGNISSVTTNENKGLSALGGAATGAQLGSMFGPVGTGIGAIGGGLLGAFG